MKRTFLVKRNPELPASEDNWITMNSFEFAMFMKTEEGKLRRKDFGQLDGADIDDTIYVIECGGEKAKELKKESNRRRYLRKNEKESGFLIVSYEETALNEEKDDKDDLVMDPNIDVEAEVIDHLMIEKLMPVIAQLSMDEYDLLYNVVLSDSRMNLNEYSKQMNIPYSTVSYRYKKVINRLKDAVENDQAVLADRNMRRKIK